MITRCIGKKIFTLLPFLLSIEEKNVRKKCTIFENKYFKMRAFQSQASKKNTFSESLMKKSISDIFKNVINRNFFFRMG